MRQAIRFRDRSDAGRRLADLLVGRGVGQGTDVVVLGLPRGGVVVAAEVARRLGAPLDVVLVGKVGAPWQPELAAGAVGEGGVLVVNDDVVAAVGWTRDDVERAAAGVRTLLADRARRYRDGRPPLDLHGRTAIVVDDGVATGATARAACRVVREHGAARVVLAVPVAPPGWESDVGAAADVAVSCVTPPGFAAVGESYDDFAQTSDDEVIHLMGSST